jgi:hypothetical protein
MSVRSLEDLCDPNITEEACKFYTSTMPSARLATPSGLSKALHAVVTRRDKVVAHNEMIDPRKLPQTTWEEIERLIAYAQSFIATVGIGYTNTAYNSDDGHYFLGPDAEQAARVLKKLLIKAELVGGKFDSDMAVRGFQRSS